MIFGLPLATIITIIPLIGMLFILGIEKKDFINTKMVTLWCTGFSFLFSILQEILLYTGEKKSYVSTWFMSDFQIEYRVLSDAFSVTFVLLISFICFLCVLWIFQRKIEKNKNFFVSLLILESFAFATFYSDDIFQLFIFMEAAIIPVLFLIIGWKRGKNDDAVFQFLIYTILSAFLILCAFILIYAETKTSSISEICKIGVKDVRVFWLLLIGVAVKMPIWPFSNWLPIVHVKSQTIASVILASIILKFSVLILIKIIYPLFPNLLIQYREWIMIFSVLSIVFAASALIFQDDLKKFFAYFSIIHMNLYFLILLCDFNTNGFCFSMVQHSITMALMFFICDMIRKVFKTRSITGIKSSEIKFLEIKRLVFVSFMIIISAPLSWGFICEIISIYSIAKVSLTATYVVCFLIIVISSYTLYVYNSLFGILSVVQETDLTKFTITDNCKNAVLLMLMLIILSIGIFPNLFFSIF